MFLASEAARMWHLHIFEGIVRRTYTGHSNNSVFLLLFFCHVEHCQLTTCSVWHESLPDHSRPCQNTWHLIMLRHAIGWNLRVCLLWLTGVESSITVMTWSLPAHTRLRYYPPPPKQGIVLYSCYCKALRVHLEMKRSTNVHLRGLSTNKGIHQRLKARQQRPSRLW